MGILGSSIARLMLAVLTAAIGFMTLKTQSEFWFGVLVATTFAWGLLALDAIVADARERDRPFWGTFLLAMLAALIWGFGPLSDWSTRGEIPTRGQDMEKYTNSISYLTIGLLKVRHLTAPHSRTEALTYDDDGKVHLRIAVAHSPDGTADSEQIAYTLASMLKQDIFFFSPARPGYATHYAVTPFSMRVYLHAGHLLLALLSGFITAAGSILLYSYWCRRQESAPSRSGPDAPRRIPSCPPAIQAAENAVV